MPCISFTSSNYYSDAVVGLASVSVDMRPDRAAEPPNRPSRAQSLRGPAAVIDMNGYQANRSLLVCCADDSNVDNNYKTPTVGL